MAQKALAANRLNPAAPGRLLQMQGQAGIGMAHASRTWQQVMHAQVVHASGACKQCIQSKVQFIQAAQAKRRIATLAPGKAAQVQQVTGNR